MPQRESWLPRRPAKRQGTPISIVKPVAPTPRLAAPAASITLAPPPPISPPANNPFTPNAVTATTLRSSGSLSAPPTWANVATVPVLPNALQPGSPSTGPTPLEQAPLPPASSGPLPVDLAIGRSPKVGRALDQRLIADQDCFKKGKDKG
jgi:hypothetical protein